MFRKNLMVLLFITSIVFTGCDSSAQKVKDAKEDVQDAKIELSQAQKDSSAKAIKEARENDYRVFKIETDAQIKTNNVRIDELKSMKRMPGKSNDADYTKRINELKKRNTDLKTRLDSYDTNTSDWDTFKREFKHDLDELGQSLKDFTVNNKN